MSGYIKLHRFLFFYYLFLLSGDFNLFKTHKTMYRISKVNRVRVTLYWGCANCWKYVFECDFSRMYCLVLRHLKMKS